MKNIIIIIGVNAGGADSLSPNQKTTISQAHLLMGGVRNLSYFPDFRGERVIIGSNIATAITRLEEALIRQEAAVVLASGDPLCFGIGSTLRRHFPAEVLKIEPAPSAFQLAFAALAEPWQDVRFLSAHNRPLEGVIAETSIAKKVAILTDEKNSPAIIAQALIRAGLSAKVTCAICENLGGPEQRIIRTTLGATAQTQFAALNVFIVWANRQTEAEKSVVALPTLEPTKPTMPSQSRTAQPIQSTPAVTPATAESPTMAPATFQRQSTSPNKAAGTPIPPGLNDDQFITTNNQLTRREVRLLTLAELALRPTEILWDIGAGVGAVSIEAARANPTVQIYAIESRTDMIKHMVANLKRFPVPNLKLHQGSASQAVETWPDPNAIFVGGSRAQLPQIIEFGQARLKPTGRLVLNITALDSLEVVRHLLPDAAITQVQINRSRPILNTNQLEALNPIFIVTWHKPPNKV